MLKDGPPGGFTSRLTPPDGDGDDVVTTDGGSAVVDSDGESSTNPHLTLGMALAAGGSPRSSSDPRPPRRW